jgi:hypothetical protein
LLTLREPTPHEILTAPGDSPFRIKGVAWRDTLARHQELPGGCEAVARQLPNDSLRGFYAQSFLASGWYDVLPMMFVDAAAARVAGLDYGESLRSGTRRQANRVLSGVYRTFMRMMVPSAVAWSLPRLAASYYDFGAVETERVDAQHVRGTVRGVPRVLAAWYATSSLEFVLVALELSGCVRPTLDWAAPHGGGTRDGYVLTDLTFDIRWVGTREA